MAEKPRMSIFAQRMQKGREGKNIADPPVKEEHKTNTNSNQFGERSYVCSTAEADSIHLENVEKLSSMSQEELILERQKLLSTLDPELVEYLKSRRTKYSSVTPMETSEEEEQRQDVEVKPALEEEDVKNLVNKYPHMDVVEDEKLQWIGELPKDVQPPKDSYSARFNFEGELLPFIDKGEGVLQGLHNHGEEQERPGYTLQELIQLSRSSVLQQRVISLNCLAKIMANASRYNEHFNKPILPALLDADMYLLLRFSLDDPAPPIVIASATAICNLIVNHTDELCLDVLMGSPLGIQQPSLGVIIEMKPEEVAELKDQELLKLDIIKGMFRTNILERMIYVIKNLPSEPIEVKSMIKIFTRIARHSYDSAEAVFSCSGLLNTVEELLKSFKKGSYYPEAVKLFRILAARSITLAKKLVEHYSIIDIICQFIAGERAQGHPEEMQLSLESFYTWQTFMNYNLTPHLLSNLFPVIMKMLEAHAGLTNLTSVKSDLEHGTALISTLSLAAKHSCEPVFKAYPLVLQVALKWISQLATTENPSFSACKLVGSTLQFMTNCSSNFDSAHHLNPVLLQLFEKGVFSQLISKLRKCSWLICGEIISCPENLPCLGSLPPIVHKESVLPFVIHLGMYLLSNKNHQYIERFVCDPQILLYIRSVLKCENLKTKSGHWYARPEIYLLSLLVHLYTFTELTVNSDLYHKLAFALVVTVQSGDKYLLPEIFSKTIFNKKFFGLDVNSVSEKLQSLKIEDSVDNKHLKKTDYLQKALINMPKIEKCYIQELGLGFVNKPSIPSTLTGTLNATQSAVPSDWIFLPILRVYDNQGNVPNSLDIITCCLQWFVIMEELFPEIASSLSFAAKYCRLCCVYLADNDLFREVTSHLEICLTYIIQNFKLLDFETEIPGLKSFYDFYRQILDQYVSVSYCDEVFGQYIVVPLGQKHSTRYKKLVWSELAAVLRILRTPLSHITLKHYTDPVENDYNLLMTYLHALATGPVKEAWCPILYTVAIHHVSHYVAAHSDNTAKALLSRIEKLGNEDLKQSLLKQCTIREETV
ncbi:RNA polymerase II-associated protein 1 [Cimex lectularius]|uniref:RNA polymerase II-associated protein 1 n=1 Tax=Cimex lectularius TaxID=79782 RepID=A0A8I6RTQ7_CIMLE|nr:RNA polymerase II-associated protein 1 [Cimex lectularius]